MLVFLAIMYICVFGIWEDMFLIIMRIWFGASTRIVLVSVYLVHGKVNLVFGKVYRVFEKVYLIHGKAYWVFGMMKFP